MRKQFPVNWLEQLKYNKLQVIQPRINNPARTSNMWISHPGLVLQSYLINRDYHLLVNNNKGEKMGGGGGGA